MSDSKYHHLVAEMKGGIEWRDLRDADMTRNPERDVEITTVDCHVVGGNFPWNLITVETDAGVTGLGEAFTGPISEHVEYLEPGLLGENPYDVERLTEHLTQLLSGLAGGVGYSQAAVSGIETALWDVVGKLTGLPVYQLLGGKYRDEIRIYCDCHAGEHLDSGEHTSFTAYDPEAYADAAEAVVGEGFDALKFDLDVARARPTLQRVAFRTRPSSTRSMSSRRFVNASGAIRFSRSISTGTSRWRRHSASHGNSNRTTSPGLKILCRPRTPTHTAASLRVRTRPSSPART